MPSLALIVFLFSESVQLPVINTSTMSSVAASLSSSALLLSPPRGSVRSAVPYSSSLLDLPVSNSRDKHRSSSLHRRRSVNVPSANASDVLSAVQFNSAVRGSASTGFSEERMIPSSPPRKLPDQVSASSSPVTFHPLPFPIFSDFM